MPRSIEHQLLPSEPLSGLSFFQTVLMWLQHADSWDQVTQEWSDDPDYAQVVWRPLSQALLASPPVSRRCAQAMLTKGLRDTSDETDPKNLPWQVVDRNDILAIQHTVLGHVVEHYLTQYRADKVVLPPTGYQDPDTGIWWILNGTHRTVAQTEVVGDKAVHLATKSHLVVAQTTSRPVNCKPIPISDIRSI